MMLNFTKQKKSDNAEILTEISVDKFGGNKFKIDISVEKQSGHHGPRVKICRDRVKSNGTSVPILYRNDGKYLPYEVFINNSACEIEEETADYLPLAAGFAALYQKELGDILEGRAHFDDYRDIFRGFAARYMIGRKILVSRIKSDLTDKMMNSK